MLRLRLPLSMLFTLCLFLAVFASWQPAHAACPAQVPTFPAQGTVNANANLRGGPGTTFAKVGGVKEGDGVTVVECNDDCTWYHLDSEAWIAASLVDLSADKPSAAPTARPSTATRPTASDKANLRSGPGQQYAVVGSAAAGQTLDLVGRSADSGWYATRDGNWISATLVDNAPSNLPVKATPTATGIGISRRALQAVYEPWGFVFTSSPLLDGRQRVMADQATTMVELIGPASEVEEASVIAIVPNDDPDAAVSIVLYMMLLPQAVLPGWDSSDWVGDHIEEGIDDPDGSYKTSIRVDDKLVTLSIESSIATLLLTIEPAR